MHESCKKPVAELVRLRKTQSQVIPFLVSGNRTKRGAYARWILAPKRLEIRKSHDFGYDRVCNHEIYLGFAHRVEVSRRDQAICGRKRRLSDDDEIRSASGY